VSLLFQINCFTGHNGNTMVDDASTSSNTASAPLSCTDINIQPPVGRGIDLEVVGLLGTSNGRQCCLHECCSRSLKENDLL
jgi:hypothetical protein